MLNAIGVDIGCTKMHLTAKVNGGYVDRRASTGLDCEIEHIKQEIDTFIGTLPYKVDVLGLAVPGLVDGDSTVKYSDVYNLNGVDIEYFTDGKMSGKIINDVKAATWAEVPNYPSSKTIAVIMCGTGIAVGVYNNGEIFLGGRGYAGELGYCILGESEGKPKTVDELAGGASILRRAKCSANELLERLGKKETEASQIIREVGRNFGYTLTNILHLFNPDIIVVGGSTATYPGYMEEAVATVEKHTIKDIFNSCQIVGAKDNKRIVALGAIEFAMGE
ncbi:MAG: ROK family protein [Chloroflexota bacterium]